MEKLFKDAPTVDELIAALIAAKSRGWTGETKVFLSVDPRDINRRVGAAPIYVNWFALDQKDGLVLSSLKAIGSAVCCSRIKVETP